MVANTLQHNLRQTNRIGKWGGEEFVVLLSDVDENGMKTIAGKLLVMIAGSRLDLEGGFLQVTVSIGATLAYPDDDPDSLVRRADELMYASKQAGRNRITVG